MLKKFGAQGTRDTVVVGARPLASVVSAIAIITVVVISWATSWRGAPPREILTGGRLE